MKRLLALIFVLCLLAGVAAGCKNNENKPSATTTTTQSGNDLQVKTWNDLPTTDFGTASGPLEFKILGRSAGVWGAQDLFVEQTDNSALGSAVYERNAAVELRHNIKIKVEFTTSSIPTLVEKLSQAGTNEYDLYDIPVRTWGSLLLEGYFKDLKAIDNAVIDLSDSWWSANFVEDLTLYGQLYGIISDATYVDKQAISTVFFNPGVIADLGLENPYDLVDNNAWTMEKMKQMGLAVSLDSNGDGVISLSDGERYGICGESYNMSPFLQAGGVKLVSGTGSNIELIEGNPLAFAEQVFSAVFDLVAQSTLTYNANDSSITTSYKGARNFFENQQTLFFVAFLNNAISYLSQFQYDYGILPMPKYTPEQERYYCGITAVNCPVLCIPINVKNVETVAVVMQALACKGKDRIMPTYYNTALKGQATRDSESWKMLDLIFENRTFDIAGIYIIGDDKIRALATDRNNNFSSEFEKIKGDAKTKIDKIVGFYDKNYG